MRRIVNVLSHGQYKVKPLSARCDLSATPFGVRELRSRFCSANTASQSPHKIQLQSRKRRQSRRTPKSSLRLLPRFMGLFTQQPPNPYAKSFPCNPNKCSILATCMRLYLWGEFYEHARSPSGNPRERTTPAPGVLHLLRMPPHFPRKKRRPALPRTLRLLLRCPALTARTGDQHPRQASAATHRGSPVIVECRKDCSQV